MSLVSDTKEASVYESNISVKSEMSGGDSG